MSDSKSSPDFQWSAVYLSKAADVLFYSRSRGSDGSVNQDTISSSHSPLTNCSSRHARGAGIILNPTARPYQHARQALWLLGKAGKHNRAHGSQELNVLGQKTE